MQMGRYFQIQDDYLDCFGTPEQIGKIGRDIEENKCGWLAVQALKLCNEEQVRGGLIIPSRLGNHELVFSLPVPLKSVMFCPMYGTTE